MEMTLSNKAMQPLTNFAVQFNKNSFGLIPAVSLNIPAPIAPNGTTDISLPLNSVGPVMKMEPLTNLQVALKNNVDVFYFAVLVSAHVFFTEDGMMDKKVFLATWKDIPPTNEFQQQINNVNIPVETILSKFQANNVFTIANRNVEGQTMLYQSVKLTNGIWVLSELKMAPDNPTITLSLKSRSIDVAPIVIQSFEGLLHS